MATSTTNVGFEEQLWQAADKLRSNMDGKLFKVARKAKHGDSIEIE